jgi:hypothetical protein
MIVRNQVQVVHQCRRDDQQVEMSARASVGRRTVLHRTLHRPFHRSNRSEWLRMDQLFDLVGDHGAEASPPPDGGQAATASEEFRVRPVVTVVDDSFRPGACHCGRRWECAVRSIPVSRPFLTLRQRGISWRDTFYAGLSYLRPKILRELNSKRRIYGCRNVGCRRWRPQTGLSS